MSRGDQLPMNPTRPAPPQLLVSVRTQAEANDALCGGADWIDLKEPANGALGAVDVAAAARIANSIGPRRPVSAAAGELLDWPTSSARSLLRIPEILRIKLGLFGCSTIPHWPERWRQAWRQAASVGKQLVPVAYADAPRAAAPPLEAIASLAAEARSPFLLVDTWDKAGPPLLQLVTPRRLSQLARRAETGGARLIVAGRLSLSDFAELPLNDIRIIAVRGAACTGGRNGRVNEQRVRDIKNRISVEASAAGAPPSRRVSATRSLQRRV